jgi:hypothetical protein
MGGAARFRPSQSCEACDVELAGRGGKAARIALGVVAAVVLVLVLTQLFLPGIAVSRIRGRVEKYGTVRGVSVTAWPAVELLWGRAGSVDVKAGNVQLSAAQMTKLLREARGADNLYATAESLKAGPLQLRDATLTKHGNALAASAWTSTADVQAALGRGFEVKLLHSGGGLVQLSIGGGLFGVRASIDAVAEAREGKVILHPQVFPLEALKLTVFDEPGLYIEGVGASAAAGPSGQGAGYRLSLRASLR